MHTGEARRDEAARGRRYLTAESRCCSAREGAAAPRRDSGSFASMEQDTPERFFAARSFELRFSEADGFVWADLHSINSGALTAPRYGRGADEASTANGTTS